MSLLACAALPAAVIERDRYRWVVAWWAPVLLDTRGTASAPLSPVPIALCDRPCSTLWLRAISLCTRAERRCRRRAGLAAGHGRLGSRPAGGEITAPGGERRRRGAVAQPDPAGVRRRPPLPLLPAPGCASTKRRPCRRCCWSPARGLCHRAPGVIGSSESRHHARGRPRVRRRIALICRRTPPCCASAQRAAVGGGVGVDRVVQRT